MATVISIRKRSEFYDESAILPNDPYSDRMDDMGKKINEIYDWIYSENFITKRAGLPRQSENEKKFLRLAGRWCEETQYCSSLLDIAMNPNYQQIIGMGTYAIPFILNELKKKPGHWFWALKAITGEDPVQESDRGNLVNMRSAWLDWGADNGYLG